MSDMVSAYYRDDGLRWWPSV